MFIVTNRRLYRDRDGFEQFGDLHGEGGANDLSLVEVTRRGRGHQVEVLDNWITPAHERWDLMKLTPEEVEAAGQTPEELRNRQPDDPNRKPDGPAVTSGRYVARRLLDTVADGQKHFVLFVHGFNVPLAGAVSRAEQFEKDFGVETMIFSWPARGGGIRGTLNYRDDKRDARSSAGALDRVAEIIDRYLGRFRSRAVEKLRLDAVRKFRRDEEAQLRMVDEGMDDICPYRLSLVCHSMGNYVLKHAVSSSEAYLSRRSVFDNIVLVAPDTNHENHTSWVGRLQARRRIYVCINEDDYALAASRLKVGAEQKARLGHVASPPHAANARYIDFTDAKGVGKSHGYFEITSRQNWYVSEFFRRALSGGAAGRAEDVLEYYPDSDTYRPSE